MASQPLVLSDPRMVAEFVRQSEFKGITEQRFAVPPDYAALLFVNGELKDTFKGGHFSVGGLMNALKGIIGGSQHVGMLLADLKPFQIEAEFEGVTRDHVETMGKMTVEMQVNPDHPSNILGMMHGVSRGASDKQGPGRKALSRMDIYDRIQSHLHVRVIQDTLAKVDAEDLRGNAGVQDKIQADMMTEIERIFGNLGLMVNAVSVNWAKNEVELEAMRRAKEQREEEAADFELTRLKRQIERNDDAYEFQLNSEVDRAKLQSAAEDELERLALDSQVGLIDARTEHERRQAIEALGHEIKMLRSERVARFENEIAEADQIENLTRKMKKRRELELEIDELEAKHTNAMKKAGAFNQADIDAHIQRQQHEHLKRMQELDHQNREFDVKLRIMEAKAQSDIVNAGKKTDADGKIDQIKALRGLSAAEIKAITAGLSPDVAKVLVEEARAQADGASNAKVMEVMQQMVEAATASQIRSEQQARDMFSMGMAGAANVAQGTGHKAQPGAAPSQDGATEIECPKCGRKSPATSRFCMGCGNQLRV